MTLRNADILHGTALFLQFLIRLTNSTYEFFKREVRSVDYMRSDQETRNLSLQFADESTKKPLLNLGSFVAVSYIPEAYHSQLL